MELLIPKRFETAFIRLNQCPDDRLEAIFRALEGANPALRIEDLAQEVASEAGVPPEDLRQLLEALSGLYLLMDEGPATARSIAEDVAGALKATGKPELDLDGPALETFRGRLERALSFEGALGVTAKALDVKLQQERYFCKARTLTDIRPVFPFRAEGTPAGFLVMHDLQIRYHKGRSNETEELHVALDGAAVDELLAVLERAKRKEEALKALLKSDNLPVFERKEDGD